MTEKTTPTRMSHPEELDEHGTRHRHGCHRPGETFELASARGWAWARCAGCGRVRLGRARRAVTEGGPR